MAWRSHDAFVDTAPCAALLDDLRLPACGRAKAMLREQVESFTQFVVTLGQEASLEPAALFSSMLVGEPTEDGGHAKAQRLSWNIAKNVFKFCEKDAAEVQVSTDSGVQANVLGTVVCFAVWLLEVAQYAVALRDFDSGASMEAFVTDLAKRLKRACTAWVAASNFWATSSPDTRPC